MSLPRGPGKEDDSEAEGHGCGQRVGGGTRDTHTTVHTTQQNWNQTIYFTAYGGRSPLTNHCLSGRVTQVTGATFESRGELTGWGRAEGCRWLGVC